MTEHPLLSVCLITYNHAAYVRQAIDSILMQKVNFSYELIIADDCSKDETRTILNEYKNKYPDKIKLIFQEKNVGPARNWMDLITAPKSKYIAYFEGDDYWTDDQKLQKQVDFLESNLGYSATTTNTYYLKNGRTDFTYRESKELWLKKKFGSEISYLDIAYRVFPHTSSWMFRNNIEYPPNFLEYIVGDMPLFFLIADKGKIRFTNEISGVYRIHDQGAIAALKKEDDLDSLRKFNYMLLDLNRFFNGKYTKETDLGIKGDYIRTIRDTSKWSVLKGAFANLNTLKNQRDLLSFNFWDKIDLVYAYFEGVFLKRKTALSLWLRGKK